MNKNLIIGGAVAIAVVVAGWYFAGRGGGEVSSDTSSLRSMLAQGGSRECTFSTSAGGYESSGTVYFRDGKMRGDFATAAPSGRMESHAIIDNGYMYGWSDASPMGIKIALDASADLPSASDQPSAVGLDAAVDYDCKGANPDSSLFVPPASVTFTDFGSVTAPAPVAPSGGGSGNAQQCAACQQVPEGYRAQCLASLGCN